MKVADVMTRDIEFVDASASVAEAAAVMGDLGVGALPVGSAEDLQGVLTDRDILFRVVAKGLSNTGVTVGDVMTTTLYSCRQEDPVQTALDLMGARNLRRLPVLDANGVMVGLITLSDLSRRMLLDNGVARAGTGGGICQLANLLHWMVLHSPLTVTERSEHSFDPFPDNGRVLPWGVGCAVYFNYVDLRFRNDTDVTFQVRVRVGERNLEGELRASEALPHSYSVHARDEGFDQVGSRWYRHNEIWRDVIDRRTGQRVGEELLKRNRALVTYDPTVGA